MEEKEELAKSNGEDLEARDDIEAQLEKMEKGEDLEEEVEDKVEEPKPEGKLEEALKVEEEKELVENGKSEQGIQLQQGLDEVEAVRMTSVDGATYVQYVIDPKTNTHIPVSYTVRKEITQNLPRNVNLYITTTFGSKFSEHFSNVSPGS